MWPAIEAALGTEEVFDFGMPKTRGEFLVYGSACSPAPVQALEVMVRVGATEKRLNVFGERVWGAGGMPGEPAPFESMRICHANTFGGENYPLNPLGKGTLPDASGTYPVPNVQEPGRPVLSPADSAAPAGLTALPMTWPQRMKHLGTVDDQYLLERWPGFPRGTDPEYFNAAPENQRIDGFFRGDEAVEIHHMHPAEAVIRTQLPGLRARLFVHQTRGDETVFAEVPCRAETLWLFPDQKRGILLYRGAVAVADETLDDVAHLFARWEPLSEAPKPVEHYHRLFLESLAPPLEAAPAEVPDAPPAAETEVPEALAVDAGAAALSPELENLLKEADALEAQAVDMLKKAGLDPDAVLKKVLAPEPTPEPTDLKDLAQLTADLEAQTKALLAKFNVDEAAVLKLLEPQPETPPPPIDEIIAQMQAAGMRNPEIEDQLREVDKLTKTAAASLESLESVAEETAAGVAAPQAPEPPPEAPPAQSPLTVDEVLAMHGSGKSLARRDLTGLDFTGQNLSGADFTETVLENCIFKRANLSTTLFTGAILTGANLGKADLKKAHLKSVSAGRARLAGADLTGADLTGGDFTGADFTGAALAQAMLTGAIFEGAKMAGTLAFGIHAAKAGFIGADLTGADLSGANLAEADFSGVTLSGANLTGAAAEGLRLFGAKCDKTVFRAAVLGASRADREASFMGADLRKAVLRRANWEGANLAGADLTGAVMDNADLGRATLTDAILRLAHAKEANFMKADLTGADLTGINLFKGSFRRAVLISTILRSANLYGVDFYKTRMGATVLDDANTKRTLLTLTESP